MRPARIAKASTIDSPATSARERNMISSASRFLMMVPIMVAVERWSSTDHAAEAAPEARPGREEIHQRPQQGAEHRRQQQRSAWKIAPPRKVGQDGDGLRGQIDGGAMQLQFEHPRLQHAQPEQLDTK